MISSRTEGSPARGPELYWSVELEELHEESSRTSFIDVWTRAAMIERLAVSAPAARIVDIGCSTGYLLEDLSRQENGLRLVGVDFLFAGLRKAGTGLPGVALVQADACQLPFVDGFADAIVSANLLEHVPDDSGALAEMRRALRPGGRAVIVVPAAPGTYDYFDRYLRHQRRYARGELRAKATSAGFSVVECVHLGSLLFPPFWLIKKKNRVMYDHLEGEALAEKVADSITRTEDSRLGGIACRLERWLLAHHVELPFGVRQLAVLEKPSTS
jgi:SAM-dependent methyltransferase